MSDLRASPSGSDLAQHWTHEPGVCFLNHGSFGGCPRQVLAAQDTYRAMMEAEPVRYFVELAMDLLDTSRAKIARMIKCDPAGLVFVPNATTAVATILDCAGLRHGDEVLVTSQEYPACRHNVARLCERAGARVITAVIPMPVVDEEQIVSSIMSALTPRTRLALISHTTSTGAIILPVARLVRELADRGVDTIVDGAHGVGFIPLDVASIGAAWYTTNCHKWLCAPKGAAVLHVREDKRERMHPLVLSNFAPSGIAGRGKLQVEFDYVGTSDVTAWIAAGDAVDIMAKIVPGGWNEIMRRNHTLAMDGRDVIRRALEAEVIVPDHMCGSMALIPLPPAKDDVDKPVRYQDALQDVLVDRHRIQVPVYRIGERGQRVVRISAQVYNAIGQYAFLAEALGEELKRGV